MSIQLKLAAVLQDYNDPPSEVPRVIYHYTKVAAFQEIIEKRCIWATHHLYLNDRGEFYAGMVMAEKIAFAMIQGTIPEMIRRIEVDRLGAQKEYSEPPFIASFSFKGNDLSQWRAYADNGAGYSIGFDARLLPFRESLRRCIYSKAVLSNKIRRCVKTFLEVTLPVLNTCEDLHEQLIVWEAARTNLYGALMRLAARYKMKAFHVEHEWRLILNPPCHEKAHFAEVSFRPGPRGLVPYRVVPLNPADPKGLLPLARVTVGPTQQPREGLYAAKSYLTKLGYHPDVAVGSGIPYRG